MLKVKGVRENAERRHAREREREREEEEESKNTKQRFKLIINLFSYENKQKYVDFLVQNLSL